MCVCLLPGRTVLFPTALYSFIFTIKESTLTHYRKTPKRIFTLSLKGTRRDTKEREREKERDKDGQRQTRTQRQREGGEGDKEKEWNRQRWKDADILEDNRMAIVWLVLVCP